MAPLLMRMILEHSLGRGVPGMPTKRYLAEYLEQMLGGLLFRFCDCGFGTVSRARRAGEKNFRRSHWHHQAR